MAGDAHQMAAHYQMVGHVITGDDHCMTRRDHRRCDVVPFRYALEPPMLVAL